MARVVVAGAGAIGASIAYHLGLRGADDVVLADVGEIAGGATGKAMGGVRQQFTTEAEVRLAQASVRLFQELGAPLFEQVGYGSAAVSTRARSSPAASYIDFRGPKGTIPTYSFSALVNGADRSARAARQDRRRRRDHAVAPGPARDVGRQRADVRPGDPGERDLDAHARPAAADGARVAEPARDLRAVADRAAAGAAGPRDLRRAGGPRRRRRLRRARAGRVRARHDRPARGAARRSPARGRRDGRGQPPARDDPPPARRRAQPAARGGGPHPHERAARHRARGHPAARPGRRVARRGDRRPHRPHERALPSARARGRDGSRGGRDPAPRERDARRRQDRDPRRDPAQAGPADRRRVGGHEDATRRSAPTCSPAHGRRSCRWAR